MSIIAESPTVSPVALLVTAVLSLPALWIAVRRPVVLPERAARLPEASLLLVPALLAFAAWVVVPSTVLSLTRVVGSTTQTTTDAISTLPTTRPLDGSTLALLAVLAPLLPTLLLLAFDASARPRLFDGIGLTRSRAWRGAAVGLVATALVLPVVFLASQLTQWLWNVLRLEHDNVHSLLRVMEAGDLWVRMLSVLAAVIVAPLFEELLFRAHLQSGLVSAFRKQLGPRTARWLAIVLASLAFASIHEWWTQPIIFVLSVCIGWVYERTGNLWSAIVLHATFNGSTTLLFTLTAMNQP